MRRQTYHGGNDGIVIFVQLATSGQPRSQAGGDEADRDEGEDDGNDSKVDSTAVELIVPWVRVYDSHLANCAWGEWNLAGGIQESGRGRCDDVKGCLSFNFSIFQERGKLRKPAGLSYCSRNGTKAAMEVLPSSSFLLIFL